MDIAELGLSIRSDGVVVASDRLNKFGQDAARAERATDQLTNAFRRLAPLVGTIMAAFSVRALKDYADAWSDMQSRVGAAVKNMEAAPALMERIVDIANASYSPLAQTVEIYGRNVAVLRDLGRNAVEAADFTEALNHALVTTATKGQDADVVLNALSRSIATGKLRAMEYETIMSRSPRVLEAVAKEIGTTTTGLRALAQQGKVTGEVIVNAMINSLEELRAEAGEMPATVGDALVRIGTNFQALVGRVDQATGSSENFALSLIGLADTIRAGTDDVVRAALVIQTGLTAAMDWASNAASALGGNFDTASALIVAGAGAAGFAVTALTTAITMGLLKALAALSLALIANPFAVIIGGMAAAVTGAYLFRDQIAEIIGVDLFKVFYDGANTIIGQMKGAFDAVVVVWDHLPAQFSRIGKLAWNALMEQLAGTITMNNFLTGYEDVDLSFFRTFKHELDDAESYVEGVARAAYNAAQGVDYLNEAGERIGETWRSVDTAVAAFDDLAASAGKAGQAIDEKAAKAARKLAEAYRRIVDGAQEFVRAQQLEAGLIGMSEQAANALRYEFDLLNEARRAGITLTDADKAGFKALAEAMAEAEERTRVLTEAFDFTKSTIKGFFSDLHTGLQEGKDFWEAFGDAGVNALNKIADKLIEMALDQMINNVLRNLMGAMGGGIGGMGTNYFPPAPSVGFHTMASGGQVRGPGTGTSDSIPAWLSNGEFVVRADAVAQPGVLPLLEAINGGNMAVRMAMGGLARVQAPANSNTAAVAQSVSIRMEVQNNAAATVEVGEPRQDSNGDIVLPMIIKQIEDKMVESMNSGRLGRATQATYGLRKVTR